MAKRGPKVGSLAWERSLHKDPGYVKEVVRSLSSRAAKGDTEAAEQLTLWLADHPELRPAVRELDDLMTRAEGAWVEAVGGGDRVREGAARDEVAAIKAELLGGAAGVVEKILASSLAVCYLAHQRAAVFAAKRADSPAVAAARDRRLESAQRRLVRSVKAWELVAGKMNKGLRPKPGVKLFQPQPEVA